MPRILDENRAQLTIVKSNLKNLDLLTSKINNLSRELYDTSKTVQRDVRPLFNNIQSVSTYNES